MELWLRAKGFPAYMISSEGRLVSLKHGKLIKPYDDGKGYAKVDIYADGKRCIRPIHRLVADTFFDGDHDGYEVNHIDGNKRNNFVGNLEWCTKSQNLLHAYALGLKKPASYHPKQRKVQVVETGEVFDTLNECARHIHGQSCHITACLDGRRNTHKKLHFKAVD